MRPLHTLSVPILSVALLATTAASAQQQAGWVDPPAKSAAAPQPEAKPDREVAQPQPQMPVASVDAPARPRDARASEPRPAPRTTLSRRREPTRFVEESEAPRTDQRPSEWVRSAQRLASDYLDAVSGSNAAMVGSTPRFYADRVQFHGRSMTLTALMAEKRRFTQRWPERRYEPQGFMRTACDASAGTCVVRTLFKYHAANPLRGAISRGVSELVLTIDVGDRPLIVSERSRVLRRGGSVVTAIEAAGRGA